MPTAGGGYLDTPVGRYNTQTGWMEFKNPDGTYTAATDAQEGAGSRRDPRIGGASMQSTVNAPGHGAGSVYDANSGNFDSRYFERVDQERSAGDEGGGSLQVTPSWQLNQAMRDRLGGQAQIGQLGSGGYSEVKDPSQVRWDDELGLITDPDNMGEIDNGDRMRNYAIIAALAGGVGLAGMSASGAGALNLSQVGMGTGVGTEAPAAGGGFWNSVAQGARDIGSSVSNLFTPGAEHLAGTGIVGEGGLSTGAAIGSGAGGSMATAGGSQIGNVLGLGDLGLSNSDYLSIIRSIGGTGLDYLQSNRNRDNSLQDQAANRDFLREINFRNTDNPYQSTRNVKDPVTGQWTQTTTLKPEEQAQLDSWRGIRTQRMADAAKPVDFGAIGQRYSLPSMGGDYVGQNWLTQGGKG